MNQSRWGLVVAITTALVTGACGGGRPSEPAQAPVTAPSSVQSGPSAPPAPPGQPGIAGTQSQEYDPLAYGGPDRMQKLVEGAKKEGKLTFYTSLAGEVVQTLAKGFKEEFGIDVAVYRAEESAVATRAVQENRAGRNVVDVVETTQAGMLELQSLGLVVPYSTPEAAKIPDNFKVPAQNGSVWALTDRVSFIGFTYNKNNLPDALVPQKFEDLLKPEMKGKLGIVTSTTGVRWVGLILNHMGEQKGMDFLKKLSQQQVRVESISGAAMMDLIAAGQVSASPTTFNDHLKPHVEKGVPLVWAPLEKALVNNGVLLVGKKAPNPHAAMLFIDWMLAGNGKRIKNDYGYKDTSVRIDFPVWVPEAGLTVEQYREQFEKWNRVLEDTFRK